MSFENALARKCEDLAVELERVKAERNDYRDTSAAKEHAFRDSEARLNKALAALREIVDDAVETEGGWFVSLDVILRARHITEIEGEYDDIPGAGQRTC